MPYVLNLLSTGADLGDHSFDAVTVNNLQTLGGHGQRDGTALRGQVETTTLHVGVPTAVGASVRVRDRLAKPGLRPVTWQIADMDLNFLLAAHVQH